MLTYLKSAKDTVILRAVSWNRWQKDRHNIDNKQTGIIITDTIKDDTYHMMVGEVMVEPNTNDTAITDALQLGEVALFSIYGCAPLDSQAMFKPGLYVCHLDFVLGTLECHKSTFAYYTRYPKGFPEEFATHPTPPLPSSAPSSSASGELSPQEPVPIV